MPIVMLTAYADRPSSSRARSAPASSATSRSRSRPATSCPQSTPRSPATRSCSPHGARSAAGRQPVELEVTLQRGNVWPLRLRGGARTGRLDVTLHNRKVSMCAHARQVRRRGARQGAVRARAVRRARRAARCVVHGAGRGSRPRCRRPASSRPFVGGRRVTTAEALPLVREAFACRERRALRADRRPRACGLMGDDLGLEAERVPELGQRRDAPAGRPGGALRRCSQTDARSGDRAARARAAERERRRRGRGARRRARRGPARVRLGRPGRARRTARSSRISPRTTSPA